MCRKLWPDSSQPPVSHFVPRHRLIMCPFSESFSAALWLFFLPSFMFHLPQFNTIYFSPEVVLNLTETRQIALVLCLSYFSFLCESMYKRVPFLM